MAMQTITTKRHGHTNTKPARISATASGGLRVIISEPHDATDGLSPHIKAVHTLWEKTGLTPHELIGGHLPDGSIVWVCVDDRSPRIRKPVELPAVLRPAPRPRTHISRRHDRPVKRRGGSGMQEG